MDKMMACDSPSPRPDDVAASALRPLYSDAVTDAAGVRHAFFTREGGVSRGVYASLNCGLGSNDDPDSVRINRSRAMACLDRPLAALATLRQVHSPRVEVVDKPFPDDARPEADALVTTSPGVVLGILTADCAPVLLADRQARVIGAAHAGWRGARAGVIANTIAAMVERGARPERVVAAVGPCIGQASYEVGADMRDLFVADEPAAGAFFEPGQRESHFQFDLKGFVRQCLERAGVGAVEVLSDDTAADAERFFSYRRTTLAGGRDYGRGLSSIVLES